MQFEDFHWLSKMTHYTMFYKYGMRARAFSGVFLEALLIKQLFLSCLLDMR